MSEKQGVLRGALFVLTLGLIVHSSWLLAAEVAFLELRREDGSLVQLEPGGHFAHVAIRVGKLWLHAHPEGGVQLTRSLARFGHAIERLYHPDRPEPSVEEVWHWLGTPFDPMYRWTAPGVTYCTRLVANLLQVPPRPMRFASHHWQRHFHKPLNEFGLSPDDLYDELIQRGFRIRTCEGFLAE